VSINVEAVIVFPLTPKLTPFALLNTIVPLVASVVPPLIAAMPAAGPGVTLAVTVPALRPNVTPLELLKITVPVL
jgi:hypothetical protein